MNQRKILKFSTTILFAIALAAAFFAKGLYFDQDYFIFAAVFSALFLLYLFTTKGEKTGINSLIDWFLMAAVVLYVVFAFFALSMRDTLLQATRYGIYLMAFLIGKNLLSNYKKPYLNIIYRKFSKLIYFYTYFFCICCSIYCSCYCKFICSIFCYCIWYLWTYCCCSTRY